MSDMQNASAMPLSAAQIRAGLGVIGKHPVTLKHTFLQLKVTNSGVGDIDELSKYPGLMYLDLSGNQVASVQVLQYLPALVQLNLSNNALTSCLDYSLARCSESESWSTGDTAIGSMLTLANLSGNFISRMQSLSHHPFLEVLILAKNSISQIEGLSSLKFLQVLDLSHNNISELAGIEGLLGLRELNLQNNQLVDLSGLETCKKLSSLNVSYNRIRTLWPLRACASLMNVNAGNNLIDYIRQAAHLADLEWLSELTLIDNPCSKKQLYRRRVIRRLPRLHKLDISAVTAEERIETANLFQLEGLHDIDGRQGVFLKHFPHDVFDRPVAFCDDEDLLEEAELQRVA